MKLIFLHFQKELLIDSAKSTQDGEKHLPCCDPQTGLLGSRILKRQKYSTGREGSRNKTHKKENSHSEFL